VIGVAAQVSVERTVRNATLATSCAEPVMVTAAET
jgi:hypothetical protein